MIAALRPYPAYKNPGLPRLGGVPTHWTLRRAKYFYREVDERSVTGSEELLSVSHLTGVTPRRQKNVTMFLAESNVGHKLCQPGDLVINTMWAWMAALGVTRQAGLVSPSYGVYRPLASADLAPDYVDRLLRTSAYASEFMCRSTGINLSRLRLYPEEFLRIPILSPPLAEQSAIVRFLDHVDRRVHRYIRAKRKLVALLNEQRQAIINLAVAKGLDPTVRLKPSGVEWLQDVPEHWGVVRLRHLTQRVTSGSRGWSDYAADSGPLFIRIGNLTRGSLDLDLTDVVRLTLPADVVGETARTRVAPGDILLSITAFIGSVAVVPSDLEEAYISQHVACCRLEPGAANARWLGYVLLSSVGHTHGALCMYGGTKQGLSLDDVKNYVVLVPPRAEQDLLVKRIEAATSTLSAATEAARRLVSLVQEYRTRLIADVVTGKLDVREAAAQLPEETDEVEALDDVEVLAEDARPGDEGDLDGTPEEVEA